MRQQHGTKQIGDPMSTRALYTFKAGDTHERDWNVYKHHDGYPTGAAETLAVTQSWFAWKEPRYESDEFAAAFCAAGKSHWFNPTGYNVAEMDRYAPPPQGKADNYNRMSGGGVRFMPAGNPMDVAAKECSDVEYRYEIYQKRTSGRSKRLPTLMVKAYAVNAYGTNYDETLLFECTLKGMRERAKRFQNEQNAKAEF
jgi:hypothetical protein